MKILIDIGHPGHVHFFKHAVWELQKRGHEVFFQPVKRCYFIVIRAL